MNERLGVMQPIQMPIRDIPQAGCATHELQDPAAMPPPPPAALSSGTSSRASTAEPEQTWRGTTKGEWARHRETIRQLYLDEKRSLNSVMEIMRTQYSFSATPKQYKHYLKTWGYRKNIQLRGEDESALHDLSLGGMKPYERSQNHFQLSNGLVVDAKRLSVYLRRRRAYLQGASGHDMPTVIRPPDNYYYREFALTNFYSYDVARWHTEITTEDAMQLILQTSHATLRWARFNRAIYQALQQPKHFDRILFLMRRAPEEMRKLIQVQPPNMTNNIIQFLSTCTSEYPLLSESETRQIRAVIKSLAKYTAEILPTSHPIRPIMQGFSRVDADRLNDLARASWAVTVDVSGAQLFSPHDISIIGDWMLSAAVLVLEVEEEASGGGGGGGGDHHHHHQHHRRRVGGGGGARRSRRSGPDPAAAAERARALVAHRYGTPHRDAFDAVNEFEAYLLESGRIAPQAAPAAAAAAGDDDVVVDLDPDPDPDAGAHVVVAAGAGGDEPRWQSSLRRLVVHVLDDRPGPGGDPDVLRAKVVQDG